MKPEVILNTAASLDGVIGKKGERLTFSTEKDWQRVYKLRASCDAILVGVGTVLADDPGLTSHKAGKNPTRVIADSKARTPANAKVLNEEAETIVAVSEAAPRKKVALLKEKAEVVTLGKDEVDLTKLMDALSAKGVKKLLLEGGGTLNSAMLKENLVDEITVLVAPKLVGAGVHLLEKPLKYQKQLILKEIKADGDHVLLSYEVKNG